MKKCKNCKHFVFKTLVERKLQFIQPNEAVTELTPFKNSLMCVRNLRNRDHVFIERIES